MFDIDAWKYKIETISYEDEYAQDYGYVRWKADVTYKQQKTVDGIRISYKVSFVSYTNKTSPVYSLFYAHGENEFIKAMDKLLFTYVYID